MKLLDQITGEWRTTPRYVDTLGGRIDSQAYVTQQRWAELAAFSIYEERLASEDAPLGYGEPVVEVDGSRTYASRYPAGTDAERVDATRQQKQAEIDAQVPDGGARQLVEDPIFEDTISNASGGASERKSDLEDTPDEEVAAFDTTIHPTPFDGAGYVQAKMTTFVDIVDPWAGAPNDVYALRCAIKIITEGEEASGASARAHMFNEQGVDQGVLPFVQDATNPAVWWCQSQEGRYWSDPAAKASMRLLWDSGSLPVAETKQLNGYGDRQYAIVRAAL